MVRNEYRVFLYNTRRLTECRMKQRNITNNKIKNCGLLFELLVRQITADTLAGKSDSPAMQIMQKRFNASTELGKELQLYHAFFGNKPLVESRAMTYINMVCEQRKKLDEKKLLREKYELIKEIKTHYPLKEFLSSRDPNYTINASIYKTFATEISQNTIDSVINIRDIANARFTLVEHLSGKYKTKQVMKETSNMISEFTKQSEDLRMLTYKVLIEKFNKKYGTLNDNQKTLLREYINNTTTMGTLRTHISKEIPVIQETLRKLGTSCTNKITQIKLNEVSAQLDIIAKEKTIQDSHMVALMLAYEIIKEMTV